jgi:predicted nucleotidyltransferase
MNITIHNKESLLQRIAGHGNQIKAYGVKELGLFGSFRVNTHIQPESDVDFLVEFEPGFKTFDNFMGLSFYLEELLGRKVELLTQQSLSKYIGPHILKQVEHVSL